MSSVGTRLESITTLLIEGLTNPRWAYRHVQGILDRLSTPGHYDKTRHFPRQESIEALTAWAAGRSPTEVKLLAAEFTDYAATNARQQTPSSVSPAYDASIPFTQLCYVIARCLKPTRIIEIGVGRGASTAALLQALAVNAQGTLDSIEFPSLRFGYREGIGVLVDPGLRHLWRLHWGASADVLPALCGVKPEATLFIHDGAHSYREQRRDLSTIARSMGPDSVVLVDDVTSDALLEVAEECGLAVKLLEQRPKEYPLGVGRMR